MENSDIQKIIEGLKPALSDTVRTVVNGKIDRIHGLLEKQNEVMDSLKSQVENHISNDTEWKTEYTPYIKGLANVSGAMKIGVAIAIGVSAVIGALVAVKNYFHL